MPTMSRTAELIAEKLEITTNLEGLPHRETMAQLELTIKDLGEKERFRILKLENEYKSFIRTLNSNEIKEMYEEDEEETLEGLEETWENIQQESMLLSEDLLEKYEEDDEDSEEDGDAEDGSDFDSDDSNGDREGLYENEENNETEEGDEELEASQTSALEENQEDTKQQQKINNPEEEKRIMIQKIDTVLKKTGGKISRQDLIKITGMNIEGNEVRVRALGIKLVASLLNPNMFVAKKL
jgi:hypothetical protein